MTRTPSYCIILKAFFFGKVSHSLRFTKRFTILMSNFCGDLLLSRGEHQAIYCLKLVLRVPLRAATAFHWRTAAGSSPSQTPSAVRRRHSLPRLLLLLGQPIRSYPRLPLNGESSAVLGCLGAVWTSARSSHLTKEEREKKSE